MKLSRLVLMALLAALPARAATLNAVLEAEVVTFDPHFTTAYISRVDFAGWQCDDRVTKSLPEFIAASSLDARKRIAAELQVALYDSVPAVRWGQFAQPAAWRDSLRGVMPSSIPIFWGMEK